MAQKRFLLGTQGGVFVAIDDDKLEPVFTVGNQTYPVTLIFSEKEQANLPVVEINGKQKMLCFMRKKHGIQEEAYYQFKASELEPDKGFKCEFYNYLPNNVCEVRQGVCLF